MNIEKNKVGIVLQARMGSTRLPGKVVRPMAGEPMIAWCVERLRGVKGGDRLVVATSVGEQERPLIEVLEALGVEVFLGSENDVLDRYYQCARKYRFGHIVRATGDNPLVDVEAAEELIKMHLSGGFDYSCAFPEFGSGLPVGAGLEVFTLAALEKSWREGRASNHREHVNEYIHEHPELFKIGVLRTQGEDRSEDRLTVDTMEDFQRVERLVTKQTKSLR